ncbi:diguanylate cyclase/phosphodiesterase with PAS/PAC sensor(s) [[Leptolyngbya] sp. PCC 7376]|uniref:bifunctional diguanylate cyclase/phosphodiesterase n=1 Tax=[Leptolyngbya] sp. PCC 7376 TaxID=111781 RepID=UPI00029F2ED0|nr:EAL domain-containing protein [[Leptolyngbya] sp. PCC 7376]AFY39408.1 diguanylate cyclase/phosphodiesterase with PAS/PAC sensor(s) [[Leptolyngbya] sp. PCC 7376]
MNQRPISDKIGKIFRKVPLNVVLVVPFVTQIVTVVGLTGWLSFRNGQQAVVDLSSQLQDEVAARIEQHLDSYLETSHLVNQINKKNIQSGLLQTEDLSDLGKYFWEQLQLFESKGVIYYGDEQGRFVAAQRITNSGDFIFVKRESLDTPAEIYEAGDQGQLETLKGDIPNFIDIRERPWYKAATQAQTDTWGNIFALQVIPQIDLPASVPLQDADGNLQGVLGNNLSLNAVSEFLSELEVGKSGQTFIVEKNGDLVASSTLSQPFLTDADNRTQRIQAANSNDDVIRETTEYLRINFGSLDAIKKMQQFDYRIAGENYFVDVLPYQDDWGIEWLIIVAIPESDFMAQINENTRITILLCFGALVVAIYSGIVTARLVANPLSDLNAAAKGVARGNLRETVPLSHVQEVRELAKSFNQMTDQIEASFTQLRSLNQVLSDNESRLNQLLNALPVGVAVHDPDGELTYLNQVGHQLLNDELVQAVALDDQLESYGIYSAQTSTRYSSAEIPISRALRGEFVRTEDIELHRNNRVISLEVQASPIYNEQQEIREAVAVFQDISERKAMEAQLIHNALYDALTNLPNRNLLMERLDETVVHLNRSINYQCALLFLDLDQFKVVNDSLGHLAGDRLLIEVARRLENSIQPPDLAARIGGDEFILLLDDVRDIEEAVEIAEQIQTQFQKPFLLDERHIFMSPSIGIVLADHSYDQAADILRDADLAMYQAKASGRACYEIFNDALYEQAVRRLNLSNDLRQAIARREFIVHYQPIVVMNTGKLIGFEALVRWNHPQKGMVPPDEFIQIAEESGLIADLDLYVLETACIQLQKWHLTYPHLATLKVSVNLSVETLNVDIVGRVDKILKKIGLDGQFLTLEVTEGILVKDLSETVELLGELQARSIQISLDDFGTGYSSLSYLHRLPADNLKIDKSFIRQMQADSTNYEIVKTVAALSKNLGFKVIAEGVEIREQQDLLSDLNCDFGQGYLFSRPLPADDINVILQQSV